MNGSGILMAGLLATAGVLAAAQDLKAGMMAPDFTAQDQSGATIRLSDFRGRFVVLYFYPKDGTPGCTAEACSLQRGLGSIQKAGAAVLGVSADQVASHKAFAENRKLGFPLVADPDRKIIKAYGVSSLLMLGRASRVTFILDRTGMIRFVVSDVDTKNHDTQVLDLLRKLS